ncbi:unnamed protein product [Pedinophyceae sp. YPF-701]|nr:unnamed protein product [Pedinophyceae sp. YPF-701]
MGGAVVGESKKQGSARRATLDAVAGSIAGCISRFVVGPLDVIKIRLQVQLEASTNTHRHYTGITQAVRTIVREEGISGLWRGTVPGQLLTIPYTAVQFVTLQHTRKLARASGYGETPSVAFITGGLAGMAGTAASYPFDLLRTTLAAQGEPRVYNGLLDAGRGIIRDHGWAGIYRGMGITLLEIVPYSALQFGLYDVLNRAAQNFEMAKVDKSGPTTGVSKGKPVVQFLCGLAAGVCSKVVTHPLDVVKKRYQVAGLRRSLRYGARVSDDLAHWTAMHVARDIAAKEGVQGFFKGVLPSVIKAAPSAAVTLACYEWVIRSMADTYGDDKKPGK